MQHMVETYDHEQVQLDCAVARMGGLVESVLWMSVKALDRRNPWLAEQAVAAERCVDRIEREVQELVIRMIASRRPIAQDLRHSIAALKIAVELEHVGDLSKDIAR